MRLEGNKCGLKCEVSLGQLEKLFIFFLSKTQLVTVKSLNYKPPSPKEKIIDII